MQACRKHTLLCILRESGKTSEVKKLVISDFANIDIVVAEAKHPVDEAGELPCSRKNGDSASFPPL